MAMDHPHTVIIGGGPVGLETALYGSAVGLDVTVLEAGVPGEHVRRWGHVRLFSPFGMNVSPLGARHVGTHLPGDEEYLTGAEFIARYLDPLARAPLLDGRVRPGCRVIQVGRRGLLKHEGIADPSRGDRPFRILAEEGGREREFSADVVIDASGTYGQPNWMGPGGTPAVGERALHDEMAYGLEDILGRRRAHYEGKRTLVIGGGHSAAATVVALSELIARSKDTSGIWTYRSHGLPYALIPGDPFPERAALMGRANAIARGEVRGIEVLRGGEIRAVGRSGSSGPFAVEIGGVGTVTADRIIANVGYGPDNSIYRELQVHECWATRGPMNLAAELLGEKSSDCLTRTSAGSESLTNPEPNFFIVGAKSYGTNSNFLMRAGLEQIRDVYRIVMKDSNLDLYANARAGAGKASR